MCSIFSSIDPADYAFQTRSVRLGGHATSIRLEAMFWTVLEEVAQVQGVALGRFLSKLHDETMAFDAAEPHNFASLLRCACLTYAADAQSADARARLRQEGAADLPSRHGPSALRHKLSAM